MLTGREVVNLSVLRNQPSSSKEVPYSKSCALLTASNPRNCNFNVPRYDVFIVLCWSCLALHCIILQSHIVHLSPRTHQPWSQTKNPGKANHAYQVKHNNILKNECLNKDPRYCSKLYDAERAITIIHSGPSTRHLPVSRPWGNHVDVRSKNTGYSAWTMYYTSEDYHSPSWESESSRLSWVVYHKLEPTTESSRNFFNHWVESRTHWW